ncbi:hypothetical protein [Enterobacter mori]
MTSIQQVTKLLEHAHNVYLQTSATCTDETVQQELFADDQQYRTDGAKSLIKLGATPDIISQFIPLDALDIPELLHLRMNCIGETIAKTPILFKQGEVIVSNEDEAEALNTVLLPVWKALFEQGFTIEQAREAGLSGIEYHGYKDQLQV